MSGEVEFNLWVISPGFLVSGDVLDLCIDNEVNKLDLGKKRFQCQQGKVLSKKYLTDWWLDREVLKDK